MKNRKKYFADFLLLLTAMIWGIGFYLQKAAAETTSPFCFNAFRYMVAAIILFFFSRFRLSFHGEGRKYTLAAGAVLFLAGALQQIGMQTASIANSSFITAVYIVLVPFFSAFFLHNRIKPAHWLAALLSMAGLYLISTGGKGLSRITRGDVIVFAGSIFWALHILVIEKSVEVCEPMAFSAGQFLTAGILHLISWLTLGHADASGLSASWPYSLASGVFVLGLAFTLQVIGQKNTGETEASVLLGMESVFGALSGLIFYHEQFALVQVLGMALIFSAVLLAVMKE